MQEKLPSILLGGAVVGVANVLIAQIPVVGGCLACLLYIGAGMLAVWHYTNAYRVTLPGGQGAVMGLLAGIVAALTSGVLSILLIRIGVLPDPIAAMEASGQLSQMPPEQAEMTVRVVRMLTGPLGLLIGAVIGGLIGLIGGVIGAATFKKGPAEEDTSASSEVI
ncbi:hypothetical protein [Rhodothermus marinus]|uniref:DUF4199 domain-containing protein n=1 Tax=Rhodothermus marinus (strain ATCC 43812 / DSM 4252 / R-10) TaxID=518766 RepID=D0MJZ6_RHOM4|nr:hypothetical protein [Rhodothermus marinus]ACY48804.1 hypothetical protein Rmar_1921 [Rhodothermus marinus DSM 4252]